MLLLMAGSGEGRRLAQALADAGVDAVASMAGVTRDPPTLALPTRRGGFGGEGPFRRYLIDQGITAILDATHPFAHHISHRTARVARDMGIPYKQLLRPPWVAQPGDNWTEIADEGQAADIIPAGATVFLATGRQTLDRFAALSRCQLICRQIDPPDAPFPYPNGRYEIGRPPFSQAQETTLFEKLGVDWLVVKNAGGQASRTKLDAARALNIPVLMIARPPQPSGTPVVSVDAALKWVAAKQ